VAGSSDRPVAAGSPLRGIQAMVQRLSASGTVHAAAERSTAADALAAYTVGAARAARAELHRGTLAPRMAADLVLLADDPVTLPADQVADIAVLATIAGGHVSHDGAGLLTNSGLPALETAERAEAARA
jgi:predicted amidohydrolase YtcJ